MFIKLSPTSTEVKKGFFTRLRKKVAHFIEHWLRYCKLILNKHGFSMGKILIFPFFFTSKRAI